MKKQHVTQQLRYPEMPRSPARIQLGHLTSLRWAGIFGQLLTVIIVHVGLSVYLPLLPVAFFLLLGAAVALLSTLRWRSITWLDEKALVPHLLLDLLLLAGILAVTGGLENPFVVLLAAPVAVSAALLSLTKVLLIVFVSALLVIVLPFVTIPLDFTASTFDPSFLLALGQIAAILFLIIFLAITLSFLTAERRLLEKALGDSERRIAEQNHIASIGALAAAVAHEMSTPLSTIAVIVQDMKESFINTSKGSTKPSSLDQDIDLLAEQVGLCRTILSQLAQQPITSLPPVLKQLPLRALVEEAARPFRREDIAFSIVTRPNDDGAAFPLETLPCNASPSILHSIGVLIQNALEFASSEVCVFFETKNQNIIITITDDGPGIPYPLLGKLGHPSTHDSQRARDGTRSSLGLGTFIARTLLEQIRGSIRWYNRDGAGAAAEITIPLGKLVVQ